MVPLKTNKYRVKECFLIKLNKIAWKPIDIRKRCCYTHMTINRLFSTDYLYPHMVRKLTVMYSTGRPSKYNIIRIDLY